jgi:FkbM family methyltransferase
MNPAYLLSEFAFSLRRGRNTIDRWRLMRNSVAGRISLLDGSGIDRVRFRAEGRDLQVALRRGTADTAVLMQVFHYHEYDAPGVNWNQITSVIDAGANIGLSSLLFWARTGGRAKIVAVEPESSNVALLARNLNELNGCQTQIVSAALWFEDGKVDLALKGASVSHSVQGLQGGNGEHAVRALKPASLIKLFEKAEVDLFKIDIEGAEKEIFMHPSLPEWAPSVRCFLIECHSHFGFGASPQEIESALTPLGFKVTVYSREKGLVCAVRS